jgi:hypothetical protein
LLSDDGDLPTTTALSRDASARLSATANASKCFTDFGRKDDRKQEREFKSSIDKCFAYWFYPPTVSLKIKVKITQKSNSLNRNPVVAVTIDMNLRSKIDSEISDKHFCSLRATQATRSHRQTHDRFRRRRYCLHLIVR